MKDESDVRGMLVVALMFTGLALVITALIGVLVGWQIALLSLIAEVNVLLAGIMFEAYGDEREVVDQ